MSRRRSYPPDRPTIIWRTTSLAHLTAGSCTALVEFQGIIASCHEQAQEQAHGASSTTDRCAGPPPAHATRSTTTARRRTTATPRPRGRIGGGLLGVRQEAADWCSVWHARRRLTSWSNSRSIHQPARARLQKAGPSEPLQTTYNPQNTQSLRGSEALAELYVVFYIL